MPPRRRCWTPIFTDAPNAPAASVHSSRCGNSCGSCLPIRRPRNCSRGSLLRSRRRNGTPKRIPHPEERMRRGRFSPDSGFPLRRPRSSCYSPPSTRTSANIHARRPPPVRPLFRTCPPKPARHLLPVRWRRRGTPPKSLPSGIRLPRGAPKTAKEAAPSAPKPRAWTAESLPSAPAYLASTDSERIVPFVPPRPLCRPSVQRGHRGERNPGKA